MVILLNIFSDGAIAGLLNVSLNLVVSPLNAFPVLLTKDGGATAVVAGARGADTGARGAAAVVAGACGACTGARGAAAVDAGVRGGGTGARGAVAVDAGGVLAVDAAGRGRDSKPVCDVCFGLLDRFGTSFLTKGFDDLVLFCGGEKIFDNLLNLVITEFL